MSLCAEDEVANRIAIDAILKSSVKDALETQILAQVERKEMQWYEQVALFKVGRYSDAGWNLLRGAMEKHVDLSAPSTMRRVRHYAPSQGAPLLRRCTARWSCPLFNSACAIGADAPYLRS